MKRTILISLLLLCFASIYAQQFGGRSFNYRFGNNTEEGIIKINEGVVTKITSYNGGPKQTATYRCNSNVPTSSIFAVFDGIHEVKGLFWKLSFVNKSYEFTSNRSIVQTAIPYCEKAIDLFTQGGCESRVFTLSQLLDILNKCSTATNYEDYKKYWNQIVEYSKYDLTSVCGYVY